jgi:hypothetical protein
MVRGNSRFQPSNMRFYRQLPTSGAYSHSASAASGIWVSLFAGKGHRRRMARSSCPLATLILASR